MKKYFLYALMCVIAIPIITNPSISDFKAFTGSATETGLHRETNWFVFSKYSNENDDTEYTGFMGNFFLVEQPPTPIKADLLYHTLTNDGYDVGTIQEFRAKMQNPNKVAIIYKVFKDQYPEYKYLSLDEFKKRLTLN